MKASALTALNACIAERSLCMGSMPPGVCLVTGVTIRVGACLPGALHMIDPHLQAAMASQIGATVTHVNSSHVAMLSQPNAVAAAIIAAATKVH
jgi:hypothetical protein